MSDFGKGMEMIKCMMMDYRKYMGFYHIMQSEMARMMTYKPETQMKMMEAF